MFLLDYIICNRDRHGANIEVLQKGDTYRLAPLFDNGLSFMFSCYQDGNQMLEFDRMNFRPFCPCLPGREFDSWMINGRDVL